MQLTSQALSLLLDRGVDVAFVTGRGRLRGTLVSGVSRNVFLRLAQFERWRDQSFRLAFARAVASAKIRHQGRVLARFARNHPQRVERSARVGLKSAIRQLREARSVDEVRGIEGSAAAAYYQQFSRLLDPSGLPFPGRRRRPAPDPVNALLSFGYVLLTHEVTAALAARGFDPAVGYLHGLRYGRSSLALDVVEPFRQPVIDRLTLRLFNRKQLSEKDFEGGDKGVRLIEESRKQYLAFYDEQMRAPSAGPGSESWRNVLVGQVKELQAMVMQGEVRPFFTWKG